MFDRLFDFLALAWQWLIPWVIIDVYEAGVILRFGKFERIVEPGLNFMWPIGIEVCKAETIVRQTSYLDPQSLTSMDGKSVTISGILTYTIVDIKMFLLHIDDGETDVQNMCYGIIADRVEDTDWNDIRSNEFNKEVLKQCRTICAKYCGVKLIAVKYSDKATARNVRLWND